MPVLRYKKKIGMTRDKVRMKRYDKFTGKKILPVLVILFAFFIFLSIFIVPNLGQWLVVMDELQESDTR